MKIFDDLLAVIAPHDCIGCAAEGAVVCMDCRGTMLPAIARCYRCQCAAAGFITCTACRMHSPLGTVIAATRYEKLAKDTLWKLKFGRGRGAAAEVASMIDSSTGLHKMLSGRRRIVFTHAPTATSRVRQRGYDQSALIARSLASTCGVPYYRLLARRGHVKQMGATRTQRSVQLTDSFQPLRRAAIRGAHIILVDDVVTTGATLEAAAKCLIRAGARRVDAVVFAQA